MGQEYIIKTNKFFIITLSFFITIVISLPSYAAFKGKVVEAETGKPIEGAVVMMIWKKGHLFSGDTFFKSRDTLTNKIGMFELKGRNKINFNPLTLVDIPAILIYKGGYEKFRQPWNVSKFKDKEHMSYSKTSISFKNSLIIFELKKTKDMKKRRNSIPSIETYSFKYQQLYIKELNREYKLFNLPLYEDDNG